MKWWAIICFLVGASICIGETVELFSVIWFGLILVVIALLWTIDTIYDIGKKL